MTNTPQPVIPDDDIDIDPFAPADDLPETPALADDAHHERLDPEANDLSERLTAADRALLTEEELEAMGEDDESADADEGDDPTPANPVAAETPEAARTPTAPEAQQPTVPEPGTPPSDEAIDAADAGLKEAQEQQKVILTRYDDGEITAAERDEALAALNPVIGRHTAVLDQAKRHFEAAKEAFTREATTYLAAYNYLASADHIQAFDRHVRQVSASPLAEGLSHRQILETAHRAYEAEVALYGKTLPTPAPKVGAAAQQQPGKRQLAPKPEAPITLRNLPVSAVAEASDGKYGQLQAAWEAIPPEDVLGRELFMARMTAAERELFASMDA